MATRHDGHSFLYCKAALMQLSQNVCPHCVTMGDARPSRQIGQRLYRSVRASEARVDMILGPSESTARLS